jgi:uncharacterized membrane protein YheB (UPF0754 family)
MNKSTLTNLISILLIPLAYAFNEPYFSYVLSAGMYAFSGAITNWLAIYMLFEKVPFLYGSGVIPSRFEEFKFGIRELVLNEFFTNERLEQFFKQAIQGEGISSSSVDYEKAYDSLVEAISNSSLGGMLAMFGGSQALLPIKAPVQEKMKEFVGQLLESNSFGMDPDKIRSKIEDLVKARLDELSPQGVKEIIQKMIREHLGWLVVWGGVFGGLIGLVAEFFMT